MRAVVVHGAGDLRVDELPDPTPGAGRGARRDGVGRHLRLRPRLLAARPLRDRRRCGTRWSSATRSPAGSSGSVPGVRRARGRAGGHRPPGPARGGRRDAGPARGPDEPVPAGPVLRLRRVRPAHRRRVQRAPGGAGRAGPRPAGRRDHPCTVRSPSRSRSPCTPSAAGRTSRGRTVLVNGCGPIGSLVVAAAKYARRRDGPRGRRRVVVARSSPRRWGRTTSSTPPSTGCRRTWRSSSRRPARRRRSGRCCEATARGGTVVQVGNLPGHRRLRGARATS